MAAPSSAIPSLARSMINVRSLVEKSVDPDLLREMIGFAAERLMELEVGSATASDFGEKNRCVWRITQQNLRRSRYLDFWNGLAEIHQKSEHLLRVAASTRDLIVAATLTIVGQWQRRLLTWLCVFGNPSSCWPR